MRRCFPTALIVVIAPVAALGADLIPGPINARVVSVYDGDTMTVDAEPWPGLTARTTVRVAGVDALDRHIPDGIHTQAARSAVHPAARRSSSV